MYCRVYPLRHQGERVSWMEAEKRAMQGWLVLADKVQGGMPLPHVRLEIEGMAHPPMLRYPTVYRINKAGLFIKGDEGHDMREPIRQTWLCVPCQPGDPMPRL